MTGVSEIGQNTTIKVWRGRPVETRDEERHESSEGGKGALMVESVALVSFLY